MGLAISPKIPITVQDLFLLVLLAVGAYTDIKERKIYDKLTFPMMAAGLVLAFLAAKFPGLKASGFGLFIGFAIFVIPCELGAVGGGDAKMMMAVGALTGYPFIITATLFSFALSAFQAAYMIYKRPGGFRAFFASIASGSMFFTSYEDRPKEENVPLGVYLALGTAVALILRITKVVA